MTQTIRAALIAFANDPHGSLVSLGIGALIGAGILYGVVCEVVGWFRLLIYGPEQDESPFAYPRPAPEGFPLLGVPANRGVPPQVPEWPKNASGKRGALLAVQGPPTAPEGNVGAWESMPAQAEAPPDRPLPTLTLPTPIYFGTVDEVRSVDYGNDAPSLWYSFMPTDDTVIRPEDFPDPRDSQPTPEDLDRWVDDGGTPHPEDAGEVLVCCSANDHEGETPPPPLKPEAFHVHHKPPEIPECPACAAGIPSLFRSFTPEEAEAAYNAAEPVPLSKDFIDQAVEYATGRSGEPEIAYDSLTRDQLRKALAGTAPPRTGGREALIAHAQAKGFSAANLAARLQGK